MSKDTIDLIMCEEQLEELVKDTQVMREAECGTNHYLVIFRTNISSRYFRKNNTPKYTRLNAK